VGGRNGATVAATYHQHLAPGISLKYPLASSIKHFK